VAISRGRVSVVKSIIKAPCRKKRGKPFIYSVKNIAVFFHIMILKRITHFKTMRRFLVNNPITARLCGFKKSIPDRTTLSRRFKDMYEFVKEQVQYVGRILIEKKVSNPRLSSIDSTMHKACGNIWHKKHKKINYIPPKLRNIDKDAGWGVSEYKNWVYGYKTHLISTSSFKRTALPLCCDITSTNKPDCKPTKEAFKNLMPKGLKYLLADKGYDDKSLRGICQRAKALLITPMKRHRNMNPERKKYLAIYISKTGRKIYSQRSKTIEPLFGHIKELFGIERLSLKGLKNVQSFLSLCVWTYQTLVYYNYIYQRPLKRLKDLVCAV
jgi:hypothetical protein